jgi:hypothetical protein
MIPYKIRKYWDDICYWFKPRQKWLLKKIPNHWIDKDTLFELVILEGIKHYVEQDNGLGYEPGDYEFSQNDPEFPESQKQFDREVKENYELITKKLPSLEKELEDAWKKVPSWNFEKPLENKEQYETTYGEVDRIETEIDNLKTKIMLWAVEKRGFIWT